MSWIVSQLGAREHYAMARALHAAGVLGGLVTDAWAPRGHPLGWMRNSLRERYHPDLASAPVRAWNLAAVAFESAARLRGLRSWPLILARNRWFQRKVVSELTAHQSSTLDPQPIIFSYSYTALEPFRFAKARGWKTVLGQIDAGGQMDLVLGRVEEEYSDYENSTVAAPKTYWQAWREECAVSDHIVVNSNWSRQALQLEGIAADKIRVVPLAFEPTGGAVGFHRDYPAEFSHQRPLSVLFLSQVNLLKGIGPLLKAAENLRDVPVEFHIVGPVSLSIPARFREQPQIQWHGPVSRSGAAAHYREADVFLFPTFCDGFGLTQLEAQAWRLPVIASRFCGDVVQHGVNGLLLPEVSADAIAKVLRELVGNPSRLSDFSARSGVGARFGLKALAASLLNL